MAEAIKQSAKHKKVFMGVGLVLLLFIMNVGYAQTKKIEEPLVMDHFYEIYTQEGEELIKPLHYVTNKSDTRRIIPTKKAL